jgi:hypothetical protein
MKRVSVLSRMELTTQQAHRRLTLDLSHTLHTVVSSQDRVGRSVDTVSTLVVAPHVPSKDTVADGLAAVSSQHGVGSRVVSRSLPLVDEAGSGSVSGTVADEDWERASEIRISSETCRKAKTNRTHPW